MSETKVKEPSVTYELTLLSTERTKLPPEFAWLRWLTPDEQSVFLRALFETLVRAWQSSDVALLKREVERWQRRAQERKAAEVQAVCHDLWARHEPRLKQQRALIDELLQATVSNVDAAPSASEIRAMLEQYIPFDEKLSDEIITMRYEES